MMAPLTSATLIAQQDFDEAQAEAVGGALGVVCNCFAFLLAILVIAGMWKVFVKAGKPGWAAIIPFYNYIVILEIVGRPIWWIILLLIPCVNIVFVFIICIDLAKSFGQGVGYGIGLALLGFVFFPLLDFGDARYLGPSVPPPPGAPPAPAA